MGSYKEISADLVVLGGGPGGYTAAFRAADLGKKVVLVDDKPELGGVCLNEGCIPSKSLLHTTSVIEMARQSASHGISFSEPVIDLEKIRKSRDQAIKTLNRGLKGLAKQRQVKLVQGRGVFEGTHTIVVEGASPTRLSFSSCIIAVGSRPIELPTLSFSTPGIIDAKGALDLREIPKRFLIVGGGVIGLEMATVYGLLGSQVTIVELTDQLVPPADSDMVKPLHKEMTRLGHTIRLKTKVNGVTKKGKKLEISLEGEDGTTCENFDCVLLSVGRRPNGDQIQAEKANVAVLQGGVIEVDQQRRTSQPHIFAVGDVTGGPMLAHKAVHEGKVAAEVIAGQPASFSPLAIPSVAYTHPELAWAGLTEKEAKVKGVDYSLGVFPWEASGRALTTGAGKGLTKTLYAKETRRILGVGIVGPNAGELISEAVLAIEMGADAEDLGLTIHPHPTLSETIGLSADVAEGTVTDLPAKKKNR